MPMPPLTTSRRSPAPENVKLHNRTQAKPASPVPHATQPNSPQNQDFTFEPIVDSILKKPSHFPIRKRTHGEPIRSRPATRHRKSKSSSRPLSDIGKTDKSKPIRLSVDSAARPPRHRIPCYVEGVSPPNPFQDPLRFERGVPPCAMVIFGANGDLARRKLIPALYRLAHQRLLPPGFAVLGTSRTPLTDDAFRDKLRGSVAGFLDDPPFEPPVWDALAKALFYVPGDVGDPELYARLAAKLGALEGQFQTSGNALFYLATQPSQYAPIAQGIGAAGLQRGAGWRRLIIEKPFGHDLASARALNRDLHQVFDESSIYRIDHYLGKETVQNILAFRFSNGIFEPLWNRRYVNHVQIAAAESIGRPARTSARAGSSPTAALCKVITS